MILATKAYFVLIAVALACYYFLPSRVWKYRSLLLASWVFYGLCSPQYLWVILLLTVIDYFAAQQIERAEDGSVRKSWLVCSIVANLALLFAFKYTPFAYDSLVHLSELAGGSVPSRTWEILLPLGISFHTFQGISYTVDVYRREIRAVDRLEDYALFVAFFPQMAAGPIVRAVEFLPQMPTPPRASLEQFTDGVRLVMRGMFKKFLIADSLDAFFVSPVFEQTELYSAGAVRVAVIAWAVQIYTDFSGYTDMARGSAKWFGFELPENFATPYLATSIADFWRRWHLSFSTWLRDYLYYPLGGSRGGAVRTNANLMIVFLLCGLWHGATWAWAAYGVYNGLLMVLYRIYDRRAERSAWWDSLRQSHGWMVLAWGMTLSQLLLGLVIIRMTSWEQGMQMIETCVNIWKEPTGYGTTPVWVYGMIVLGVLDHLVKLMPSGVRRIVGREDLQGFLMSLAFTLMIVAQPGVTRTFLYIQF